MAHLVKASIISPMSFPLATYNFTFINLFNGERNHWALYHKELFKMINSKYACVIHVEPFSDPRILHKKNIWLLTSIRGTTADHQPVHFDSGLICYSKCPSLHNPSHFRTWYQHWEHINLCNPPVAKSMLSASLPGNIQRSKNKQTKKFWTMLSFTKMVVIEFYVLWIQDIKVW